MKVECVSDGQWVYVHSFIKRFFGLISTNKNKPALGPKKGDIVTVDREEWSSGVKYYRLVEWPEQGRYDSKWFKPISEQFEKVTFEQIKKEKPISVN